MSKDILDWIEYVKTKVTLHDVLHHYKVHLVVPGAKETQFRCPIHSVGGDQKPSARVYANGTGYCWGCHKVYDSISFVQNYESKKLKEALVYLEKTFNLPHFELDSTDSDRAEKDIDLSAIREKYNQPKKMDPVKRWGSINAMLIRNRASLDLTVYVKFCLLLDRLLYDLEKEVIDADKVVETLEQVKVKILQHASGDQIRGASST